MLWILIDTKILLMSILDKIQYKTIVCIILFFFICSRAHYYRNHEYFHFSTDFLLIFMKLFPLLLLSIIPLFLIYSKYLLLYHILHTINYRYTKNVSRNSTSSATNYRCLFPVFWSIHQSRAKTIHKYDLPNYPLKPILYCCFVDDALVNFQNQPDSWRVACEIMKSAYL